MTANRFPVCLDSFSADVTSLPPSKRTPNHVLAALRINPRISTWDMSEHSWLCGCIEGLQREGKIIEDQDEPYPWHLYIVTEARAAKGADHA